MYKRLVLESDNIILRPSTFEDCHYFTDWESKEYIKEFFTITEGRDYEEIAREYVLRDNDNTKMLYTIILKETNLPIGRIYISRFNRYDDSMDITRIYIGEEKYLHKGYGREALKLILKYGFEELKLERITLDFFENNKRAQNLYVSLGFKSEGVMRHVAKKNNEYINLHLMSMLRDEYFSNQELKAVR